MSHDAMTPSRPHSMFVTNPPTMGSQMITSPNNFPVPLSLSREQQNLNFQRINFLIEDALDYLNTFDVLAIASSRRQTLVQS